MVGLWDHERIENDDLEFQRGTVIQLLNNKGEGDFYFASYFCKNEFYFNRYSLISPLSSLRYFICSLKLFIA
jgi:hypothetical protein